MGVLANHVASVEALRPGVIEVIEDNGQPSKKWFGESGFGLDRMARMDRHRGDGAGGGTRIRRRRG
jgi:hypothetical protein